MTGIQDQIRLVFGYFCGVGQAAARQGAFSVLSVGVVLVPPALVHSAPPFAGAGLLHVLVFVPSVPQAVALQTLHALQPPSVAGQFERFAQNLVEITWSSSLVAQRLSDAVYQVLLS